MRQETRLFLLFESATFFTAALVHFGVLVHGYEHPDAPYAESLIALVLLAGLALTWVWPAQTGPIGLAVQVFAVLGTLVGLATIAAGIGPRTVPDVAYHLTILVVLACGLLVASRAPARGSTQLR